MEPSQVVPLRRFFKWLNWYRLLIILALAFAVFWDGVEIYSNLHQPTSVIGTVTSLDGAPIADATVVLDGGPRSRYGDSYAYASDETGAFTVDRQVSTGTVLVVYAFKRGYEPQILRVVGDRQKHEVKLVLKTETAWKTAVFSPSDRVEWWNGGDWCDAVVRAVGTHNTPTP